MRAGEVGEDWPGKFGGIGAVCVFQINGDDELCICGSRQRVRFESDTGEPTLRAIATELSRCSSLADDVSRKGIEVCFCGGPKRYRTAHACEKDRSLFVVDANWSSHFANAIVVWF